LAQSSRPQLADAADLGVAASRQLSRYTGRDVSVVATAAVTLAVRQSLRMIFSIDRLGDRHAAGLVFV